MWVFGYASLIWNPEFPVAERHLARLNGYARSFCMRSIHHRGTEDHPGLVLALDAQEDAVCDGVAFRVAEGHEEKTLSDLRERELISSAYVEQVLPVKLRDGRAVDAYVYVIDATHVQYCHETLQAQAEIISTAVGGRGPNTEYLYNTAAHLAELGIADPDLNWLAQKVRDMTQ